MSDRLLDTTETGKRLGNIHPNDVRELIHQGRLRARTMPIRGRRGRPRLYIADSEIDRFIREETEDACAPGMTATSAPGKRAHKPAEIDRATGYY